MIDPVLLHDWHPVAWSHELGEGQVRPARLLGQDLVLWRSQGQALAWKDLCPHRGTALSLGRVEQHELVCAYHGWRFGRQGRCTRIPAHPDQVPPEKACATTYLCQEHCGLLWVSLGQPDQPPLDLEDWSTPGFRQIACGPYAFGAAGPRILENFLDVAHFPFVHDGLLGDSQHPEIGLEDYQVEVSQEGLVARDITIYQPDPDGTGQGARVAYTYRVTGPLRAQLGKDQGKQQFRLFLGVCPQDEVRCLAFMNIAMNYGHDIPLAELQAFQDRIVAQDRPIVESQRPELLPLDLQAELHLRSDKAAIAYRKWISGLGLRFGTD